MVNTLVNKYLPLETQLDRLSVYHKSKYCTWFDVEYLSSFYNKNNKNKCEKDITNRNTT